MQRLGGNYAILTTSEELAYLFRNEPSSTASPCGSPWPGCLERDGERELSEGGGVGHKQTLDVRERVHQYVCATTVKLGHNFKACPGLAMARWSRAATVQYCFAGRLGTLPEARCRPLRIGMTMTMTHSEKSHIGQMRAWPYRQECRGHGATKKNLSYRGSLLLGKVCKYKLLWTECNAS